VVAHALRAGQHGRVVGQHDRAGALRTEQAAIDTPDPGDHAVGRRVAHQVLGTAPLALRRNGERAVLDKTAGVAQVGDVLARHAQAQRMATRHGLGTVVVLRECVAITHALQIGANRAGRRACTGRWQCARRFGRLRGRVHLHRRQPQQDVAFGHRITRREVPLDQPAGRRRAHLVLHLHGLDHQQHIAAAHGVTGLDQPLDNLGLQGRANIHHSAIFARRRARW
jgi:hypothetical protein